MFGTAIFSFVQLQVGDKAPKVTGMLIDLPIEDIKPIMQDFKLFSTRISQAIELLKNVPAEDEQADGNDEEKREESKVVSSGKKDSSQNELVRFNLLRQLTLTEEQKQKLKHPKLN